MSSLNLYTGYRKSDGSSLYIVTVHSKVIMISEQKFRSYEALKYRYVIPNYLFTLYLTDYVYTLNTPTVMLIKK